MKKNIGIITPPLGKAAVLPFSNLINIISPVSKKLYIVTGNHGYDFIKNSKSIYVNGIHFQSGKNCISRVIKHVYLQLWIASRVAKLSKNVDIWILYFTYSLILPIIVAKIYRKKVFQIITGSTKKIIIIKKDYLGLILIAIFPITAFFLDYIIIYSQNILKDFGLEKYQKKIIIAPRHVVDRDEFYIVKQLNQRTYDLGYIGRFSEEKGVLNFLIALKKILQYKPNIKILIIGEGMLKVKIQNFIDSNNLITNVEMDNWVTHDRLPHLLNDIKIIVIPSTTEGLPNIMLEAMACGTLILATPVGSIPDIIQDLETGFIMENNEPNIIEKNVIRALNYPDPTTILYNAHQHVTREFSLQKGTERYEKIFSKCH
jgi:glycosyltransferase involved in cell wall biosynthesis